MLRQTFTLVLAALATANMHCVLLVAGEANKSRTETAPGSKVECASAAERVDLENVDQWLARLPAAAQRGYRHLTESVYLPADLDEEVFAALAHSVVEHPPALPVGETPPGFTRNRAATFLKYGLTERPGDLSARPLQYVVDRSSPQVARWVMNCFACHGGSVYGKTLPGAPNNLYQLQSLTEDVRRAKLQLSKPLGHMDLGAMALPLGSSVGTTNAVMFGVALMNFRDAELNVRPLRPAPRLVNHDMDPPAWWLFHRKRRLYADGFAEKGVRGLMQFMLVRENGPEQFKAWESDFRDVFAFIESLRPPKYTGRIDWSLANRGRSVFNAHCARCHGTTAPGENLIAESRRAGSGRTEEIRDGGPSAEDQNVTFYPEKLIPIDEVGTDRVRLDSLTKENRRHYGESWFGYFGQQETWDEPDGYMAPPLDGVWASAPYFHNGSVPTLWHVLHPDQRPTVWQRTHLELDEARVGLKIVEASDVPPGVSARGRRQYFDTRVPGKSNRGHDFPNELTEQQRSAVLEYLKTL